MIADGFTGQSNDPFEAVFHIFSPCCLNTFDGDGARLIRVAHWTTTHDVGDFYEVNPVTGIATCSYPFNGQPVAVKQNGTIYYLHRDQVGSVVSISDASAKEVASLRYAPFGNLRSLAFANGYTALPTDRLFTGQVRDLGDDRFYFFKARYYDATIGKFQVPDSIVPQAANPQALNRYAYARNNPLTLTDPSGHVYDSPSDGGYGSTTGGTTGPVTILVPTYDPGMPGEWTAPLGTDPGMGGDWSAPMVSSPFIGSSWENWTNLGLGLGAGIVGTPDDSVSEALSAYSQTRNLVDLSLTGGVAAISLTAALAGGGPAALAVGEAIYQPVSVVTNIIDILGLDATVRADLHTHRTWVSTQKGALTVSVGGDTLVSLATTALGFVDRDVYNSTLIDAGQVAYDTARSDYGSPGYSLLLVLPWFR